MVLCSMLQQSDSVLFESLRRLELLELSVDLLKVWIESRFSHSMSLPFLSCFGFSSALLSKFLNGLDLTLPGYWDWKGCQSSSEAWIKGDSSTCADSYRVRINFPGILVYHAYILGLFYERKWTCLLLHVISSDFVDARSFFAILPVKFLLCQSGVCYSCMILFMNVNEGQSTPSTNLVLLCWPICFSLSLYFPP